MCLSSSESLNRHCRLVPVPRGCAGKAPERAIRTTIKRFVFRNAAASSGLTYGSRLPGFMFVSLQPAKCAFVIYLYSLRLECDLTPGPELRNSLMCEGTASFQRLGLQVEASLSLKYFVRNARRDL